MLSNIPTPFQKTRKQISRTPPLIIHSNHLPILSRPLLISLFPIDNPLLHHPLPNQPPDTFRSLYFLSLFIRRNKPLIHTTSTTTPTPHSDPATSTLRSSHKFVAGFLIEFTLSSSKTDSADKFGRRNEGLTPLGAKKAETCAAGGAGGGSGGGGGGRRPF